MNSNIFPLWLRSICIRQIHSIWINFLKPFVFFKIINLSFHTKIRHFKQINIFKRSIVLNHFEILFIFNHIFKHFYQNPFLRILYFMENILRKSSVKKQIYLLHLDFINIFKNTLMIFSFLNLLIKIFKCILNDFDIFFHLRNIYPRIFKWKHF